MTLRTMAHRTDQTDSQQPARSPRAKRQRDAVAWRTDGMVAAKPLMLTVDEAADELRIPPDTIYTLNEDGVLGYVKVGKHRLIPLKELERFAQETFTQQSAQRGA